MKKDIYISNSFILFKDNSKFELSSEANSLLEKNQFIKIEKGFINKLKILRQVFIFIIKI